MFHDRLYTSCKQNFALWHGALCLFPGLVGLLLQRFLESLLFMNPLDRSMKQQTKFGLVIHARYFSSWLHVESPKIAYPGHQRMIAANMGTKPTTPHQLLK